MKNNPHKSSKKLILLLVLFLCCRFATAFQEMNSVLTDDGFVLNIPKSYVEIPMETIKEFNDAVSATMGKNGGFKFRYGYQEDATTSDWFELPNVLVTVIDKHGKIPPYQLKNIEQFEGDFQQGIAQAQQSLKNIFTTDNLDIYDYDKEKKLLIATCDIYIPNYGDVTALMAIKFTEFGAILVYCYSSVDQFKKNEETFLNIAYSIEVHPDDEYSESIFGDIFATLKNRLLRKYTGIALIIIVLGGIVGIIQSRRR